MVSELFYLWKSKVIDKCFVAIVSDSVMPMQQHIKCNPLRFDTAWLFIIAEIKSFFFPTNYSMINQTHLNLTPCFIRQEILENTSDCGKHFRSCAVAQIASLSVKKSQKFMSTATLLLRVESNCLCSECIRYLTSSTVQ